jgi:hypothetical protein
MRRKKILIGITQSFRRGRQGATHASEDRPDEGKLGGGPLARYSRAEGFG